MSKKKIKLTQREKKRLIKQETDTRLADLRKKHLWEKWYGFFRKY
jgi:hypothetical protein